MKITFLGTRGNIKVATQRHQRHTVTIIAYKNTKIAVDCGLDWLGKHIDVDAFIITHGHDDHIGGLQQGTAIPVYATQESWQLLNTYPIENRVIVEHEKPFAIGSLICEAFFVKHSVKAPAVGYRISAGATTVFCVHDVFAIPHPERALRDIALYIGDGASFNHPIIRYADGVPFGHTTIKEQVLWCKKSGVARAVFTHCGSQIVKDSLRVYEKMVEEWGIEHGIEAAVAHDGMEIEV